MLVLSRRPDESLHIGDNIEIVLVEVRGNTVRLGVSAPKDVLILRGELRPTTPSESGSSVSRFSNKALEP